MTTASVPMSASTEPRKRRRINWYAVAMISPAVIALLLVGIYPLIYAVGLSLQRYHLTRQQGNGTFLGLQNYITVISDPLFQAALGRTLTFLVAALSLQMLIGMAIAVFLHYNRWQFLGNVLKVALVVPIAMTPSVVGLLGRLIYNRDFGVLNYLIGQIGIPPQSWLADPTLAMITLIMTDTWQWTPFAALVLISGLSMVPRDVEESARLDTKNWLTVFRYIQLPYMLPGITAVLIIRTAEILKLFDMPYVLTRGGPGTSTELVSLYVQRTGFRVSDIALASTQAIILLVICIVLARIYVRLFYREVEATS